LNDEEDEGDRDDYTHQTDGGLISPLTGYFADSANNFLLTRTGNDGTPYQSPNAHYDSRGPQSGVWHSEYNKKGLKGVHRVIHIVMMVVKEAPNAVVELPSTKTRRFWLWIVWLTTWWIPNFMLRIVGRMKRP
jgi:chitin synthase